jgi:hypothetical protein
VALAAANLSNAEEVELHLHPGLHTGRIIVSRSTSIIGEADAASDVQFHGSILNTLGANLVVRNVTLLHSSEPCIVQNGGRAWLKNVTINPALDVALTKPVVPRIIVTLTGGVLFEGDHVTSEGNSFTLFQITGERTKAVLSNVTILLNTFDPASLQTPPLLSGCIEVSDKATLCIENSLLLDNDYIGISVHDGGKMHLRNTTVKGTKSVQKICGVNIAVASGGVADLRGFGVCDATMGVYVKEGYLTARDGFVNNNSVGITCFMSTNDPTYNPWNCIYDDVKFIGNGLRIYGDGPVPLPSSPDSPGPDRSSCRLVPWTDGGH